MSRVNLSIKLLKEVYLGMGGAQLLDLQEAEASTEIEGAQKILSKLDENLNHVCSEAVSSGIETVEELKSHIRTINFESLEKNREMLQEQIDESEERLYHCKRQKKWISGVSHSAFSPGDIQGFWKERGFQLYPSHHIDIPGLESSQVDYFAISKNRKRAYFILVELNRNAPESNVLKLYYYLKNSRVLWDLENLVILQLFSPKYLIEKKGKSLALAREMANFLGHEMSGDYVFGEKKVKVRYETVVFTPGQYEIFSVFWKLMSDESDEEARYEVLCEKLARNSKFLELSEAYVERQNAQSLDSEPAILNLAEGRGGPEDIHQIFKSWCQEIIDFIRVKFHHYERESKP